MTYTPIEVVGLVKGVGYLNKLKEDTTMTDLEKKVFKDLVKEYGRPINVTDLELIMDIEAYGTFELDNGQITYWTWAGKFYRFEITNLCLEDMETYNEMHIMP